MLLLSLHRLALRLRPLRLPCAFVVGCGWLVMLWLMLEGDARHSLLMRATLALTLWSLVLIAFISLFRQLPPPPLPALKWHERLRMRMRLWLHYLMTAVFLALACVVTGLSLKLMLAG